MVERRLKWLLEPLGFNDSIREIDFSNKNTHKQQITNKQQHTVCNDVSSWTKTQFYLDSYRFTHHEIPEIPSTEIKVEKIQLVLIERQFFFCFLSDFQNLNRKTLTTTILCSDKEQGDIGSAL